MQLEETDEVSDAQREITLTDLYKAQKALLLKMDDARKEAAAAAI